MPLLLFLLSMSGLLWAAPVELKVWHAYRQGEKTTLEAVLDAYDAAHPELTISVLQLPFDAYNSKLESAIPQGNGPDLFIAAHERVGAWSASGLIQPLPPTTDLSGLHPITTEAITYDGQRWGMPLAFKCLALIYNRALISAPPADTDTLLALMRAEKARGQGRYALAYEATSAFFHAPWMYGFGGGVFDGDAVALDQPGNVAALAFVASLYAEGLLPEEPDSPLITQMFSEGRAAMVINGPWFVDTIPTTLDYGVAPLPTVSATGRPAAPFLTVEAAFVSARSSQPAEALELARFLAAPEAALRRAIEGKQTVATLVTYDDPTVAADPVTQAFRAQLNASVPMPNRPEMSVTWEPMASALRRVTRGALEPQAAADAAQQEYHIFSRPPPPATSPVPYMLVGGLLLVGGLGWVGWQTWQHRAAIRAWWFAYLYVVPAALAMGVLVVVPFLVGATVSLFAHHNGEFTFVGLANFFSIVLARDWALTSPLSFYFTLVITVLWTVLNVLLHVSIGLALAMLLREPWLQLRAVYRVVLILPWAVPNYITALLWKGMFHKQNGAINLILASVGLEPVSWFSQFSTAFAANLITNTWLGFPFMMVVTLGALQSIPRELEQAAAVDGATGWQRFWLITLPQLRPALLPAVILGSVWTFNMFNIIYLVSGGEPDGATDILISEAYRWAFTRGHRYGYASAYAVLVFFVLLGYSRLGNRLAGQKVL